MVNDGNKFAVIPVTTETCYSDINRSFGAKYLRR